MVETRKNNATEPELLRLIKESRKGKRGRKRKNIIEKADDATTFRFIYILVMMICVLLWCFGSPLILKENDQRKQYLPLDFDADCFTTFPKKKSKKKINFNRFIKRNEYNQHEPTIFYQGNIFFVILLCFNNN